MQAVLCDHFGSTPADLTLSEIEAPRPGPGEIAIRVRACDVNFADTLVIAGGYQFRPPLPFSPGMEMAGDVLEVGPDITGFEVGERVVGMAYYGGFAEVAVVPARMAIKLPDSMSYEQAAAFPATYSTSHLALWHRGAIRPGERLLVLGAAGGVGLAAVEIGAALGAEVIAAASSEEKLALCKAHGAAHLVNYRAQNLRGAIREITGGDGVDVCFDPVGGDAFKLAYRSMAWEGRYLIVGFASGTIPDTSVNRLLIGNFALVGVEWGTYMRRNSPLIRQSWDQLLRWFEAGQISPTVTATYPLAEAPQALQDVMDRKTRGRVVVRV